ncbi:MAG TPA: response regulator transcription factor [Hyphomicrobiaceae bacterium]|nr:response regulator transcription factor [Hyphomicrobiaceae bacterium]
MSELYITSESYSAPTRRGSRSVVLCVPGPTTAQLSAHLDIKGLRPVICSHPDLIDHSLSERGREAVILDVSGLGGLACDRLRRMRDRTSAIIVALVPANDSLARMAALDAGADACFSKPVEPGEVVTVLRALLRRVGMTRSDQARQPIDQSRRVRFGRMVLDMDASRMTGPNGARVTITALELQVLKMFASHPNKALTRDEIAELAHGRRWSPLDRSLDIRISRLRAKIEENPDEPRVIVTVRGIGYRFDADGDQSTQERASADLTIR